MNNVGRNDPCPCGSGKKFKRCHLAEKLGVESDLLRAGHLHAMDRLLVDRLVEFGVRKLGRRWFEDLLELVDLDVEMPERELSALLLPYAAYDWQSKHGLVLDLFLAARDEPLSPTEKSWIEAQRRSWLSMWEISEVSPGLSISARDMFTGAERRVLECKGSQLLVPRDVMLVRVVDYEGLSVFCGMYPRVLPPRPAAALVKSLRKAIPSRAKKVTVEELREHIPIEAWMLSWRDALEELDAANSRGIRLTNTDGDPLLLTKDRYELEPSHRASVEAKLAEIADPDDEDPDRPGATLFTVHRPGNAMHKSWDNTIVGRIFVRASSLVLETNSIARADDLRGKVEASLHPMVKHVARDHEDPSATLEKARSEPRRPTARAPHPPEVVEALREMKRRHYESWLDDPIPALGGATPREAVKKPRTRAEVVVMLKEIENGESRVPANERFDVSFMWESLELPRS